MTGKKSHHTPEGLERIRAALLQRVHTDQSREKRRQSMTGHKASDETKAKMSQSAKGRPSTRRGKTWKQVDGKRVWFDKPTET